MLYDQVEKICKANGLSFSQFADGIGVTGASVTGWKNGAIPRKSTLKKIADHFGVTVDWLLSDDPLPGTWQGHEHSDEYMPLSSHEKLLLDTWRSVDKVGQERLLKAFKRPEVQIFSPRPKKDR